ncbi:hypothetical protein E2562_019844 [Oryza meyeriana var. granulata]|uniref:DUF834 domain-containing protein n=1 Tax=Oryza meyeriana var. granulata TaxID=110450 RepID=A0A6G1CQL0_9ORYZ|nr:hypothetical protein E2562_019844 [Oryza meyeriana var. granulata]
MRWSSARSGYDGQVHGSGGKEKLRQRRWEPEAETVGEATRAAAISRRCSEEEVCGGGWRDAGTGGGGGEVRAGSGRR